MRLAPLAALALSSCASIMARPTAVRVTSEPSGIPFSTNYGHKGTTPETIVPPDQARDLLVSYHPPEGYRPATRWVRHRQSWWAWGNCLFGPLGLIGIVVDAGADQAQVLAHDEAHVVLREE